MKYYEEKEIKERENVFIANPNDMIHDGILIRVLFNRNEVVVRDVVEYLRNNPLYFDKPSAIIARISKEVPTNMRYIGIDECIRPAKTMNIEDAAWYLDQHYKYNQRGFLDTFIDTVSDVIYERFERSRSDNTGAFYSMIKTAYRWRYYGNMPYFMTVIGSTRREAKRDYYELTGNILRRDKLQVVCIHTDPNNPDFKSLYTNQLGSNENSQK